MPLEVNNLYKLATFEDNYHIHKILGFVSIFLYWYNFYALVVHRNMNLNTTNGLKVLGIHGALSLSSFIFHISKNRHSTLPIIYPEFRMHNVIFVFRSILCCLAFYYKLHVCVNIMICFVTMAVADAVSRHYKKASTTMRCMPFMDYLEDSEKLKVVRMHSFMQLVATYYMVENITTAYSPIFAIQIASFLMTLVKKGIIKTIDWHYIYSLALWMNILAIIDTNLSFIVVMNVLCSFMYYWRIIYGMNKYAGWMIVFCGHYLLKNSAVPYVDNYIDANIDIFYVLLIKYSFILYVLNSFHLKFRNELIDRNEYDIDVK